MTTGTVVIIIQPGYGVEEQKPAEIVRISGSIVIGNESISFSSITRDMAETAGRL
ncbi:MAG TPA: hypothetical protein VGP85_23810 [Pyrinomonadaceae bacterium]|nr:hypothetical protein [Pyrinomonadaceae bacterium]